MDFHLLDKHQLDTAEYDRCQGMIEIFACIQCKATVIYTYLSSGLTPLRVSCSHCGGDCYSNVGTCRQPDRVWFRPSALKELRVMTDRAYDLLKDRGEEVTKGEILAEYVTHYNKGGLFAAETNFTGT